MNTRWPVMLHGSRYKSAEIQNQPLTHEEYVICPFCSEIQDPARIGLMACIECGKTFETFVPELED